MDAALETCGDSFLHCRFSSLSFRRAEMTKHSSTFFRATEFELRGAAEIHQNASFPAPRPRRHRRDRV